MSDTSKTTRLWGHSAPALAEKLRHEMRSEVAAMVALMMADDEVVPYRIHTQSSEEASHSASAWRADTNFIIVQHRGVRRTLTFTDTPKGGE